MTDPHEKERREAREGVRFECLAETDPLWHVITIRMRVPSVNPGILTSDTGNRAARRLYRFCAAILSGSGLISKDEAARIARSIASVYPGGEVSGG